MALAALETSKRGTCPPHSQHAMVGQGQNHKHKNFYSEKRIKCCMAKVIAIPFSENLFISLSGRLSSCFLEGIFVVPGPVFLGSFIIYHSSWLYLGWILDIWSLRSTQLANPNSCWCRLEGPGMPLGIEYWQVFKSSLQFPWKNN